MSFSRRLSDHNDQNGNHLFDAQNIRDSVAGILILAGGLSTRMGSPKALLRLPSGDSLLDYHFKQAQQFGVPILIADAGAGYVISDALLAEFPTVSVTHIKDYCPIYCPISVVNDTYSLDGVNSINGFNSADRYNSAGGSNLSEGHNNKTKRKHSAGPLGAILSAMHYFVLNEKTAVINVKWLLVVSCDSLVSAADIWHHIQESSITEHKTASSKDTKVMCLKDDNRLYPLLALYQLGLAEDLNDYLDSGQRRVMSFINPVCQALTMPKSWYVLSNLNTPDDFKTACQAIR